MALAKDRKLRITPMPPSELKEIVALFNPTSYKVSKETVWKPPDPPTDESVVEKVARVSRRVNAPGLKFSGGNSRLLEFELFFDVTESTVVDGKTIKDVRQVTNDLIALTRIEQKLKRPPICLLQWGSEPTGSDFPFQGVLTKLVQDFVLFRATGEPLRAKVNVTFTEFLAPGDDLREADGDIKTRIVRNGDTLFSLAQEAYGDSTLWRPIATANGLDDPFAPPIGQPLAIPPNFIK